MSGGTPPEGQLSQVDKWLDSVGLGAVKKDLRAAHVYKIVDLANMDPSGIRVALPEVDPKLRNKLISKLEAIEIPDDDLVQVQLPGEASDGLYPHPKLPSP